MKKTMKKMAMVLRNGSSRLWIGPRTRAAHAIQGEFGDSPCEVALVRNFVDIYDTRGLAALSDPILTLVAEMLDGPADWHDLDNSC